MCDCTFLRDHYSWINRFNFINKSFLASLANSNCFCKFSISIFCASIKYGFASGEIFVQCWDFIITIELLIPISLSDMPWILLEWSFSLNADETIWSHTLHLNKFFLCTRLICWLRFFFSPNVFLQPRNVHAWRGGSIVLVLKCDSLSRSQNYLI